MKDTPILMSGEMVLALLENRKTKTRRIIKPQPEMQDFGVGGEAYAFVKGKHKVYNGFIAIGINAFNKGETHNICPYGHVRDQLWIKETFAYTDHTVNIKPGYVYRATDPDWSTLKGFKWTPSIFCTRKASRITLEITNVRVERLNEISEEDAAAEGVTIRQVETGVEHCGIKEMMPESPVDAYARLWEQINGKGSWSANPFVWAISFKRIKP